MRILYLYRNPSMGYSIGKVFEPIEKTVQSFADVDSFSMPTYGYSLKSLLHNILAARKKISSNNYDIIHITGQEHYLIPFLPKDRLVVTVHDLGFSKFSRGISGKIKHYLFIDTLNKVEYLTCISEKTRAEISRICGIEENRILVIQNCVNPNFQFRSKELNKSCPTILQIGLMDNKNIENILSAIKGFNYKLRIIAPKKDFRSSIFKNSGINYSLASDLSDAEILEEYEKCDIVSLPSLYEGFGMPIIEGQAIGRAVVTSNISPMKEVAGDGAVLVDPTDVESIRNGYLEAINNSQKYIQRGLENVKRFDISKIVEQYLDLYHNIIESNHS